MHLHHQHQDGRISPWPSGNQRLELELPPRAQGDNRLRQNGSTSRSRRRCHMLTGFWSKLDDFVVHESQENLLLFLLSLILLLPASICLEVVGVVLVLDARVGPRHWIRAAAIVLVALGILLQCLAIFLLLNVHKKYRANRRRRTTCISSTAQPETPVHSANAAASLLGWPDLTTPPYMTPITRDVDPSVAWFGLSTFADSQSNHHYTYPRYNYNDM